MVMRLVLNLKHAKANKEMTNKHSAGYQRNTSRADVKMCNLKTTVDNRNMKEPCLIKILYLDFKQKHLQKIFHSNVIHVFRRR